MGSVLALTSEDAVYGSHRGQHQFLAKALSHVAPKGLDPDEDLYIICRTGGRSFRAAQWLSGQGYSALNVAGGMDQWLETGKPLVSDNGLKPVIL